MTSPSPESEPIQEALFELPLPVEEGDSVREELGYDKPFHELTHDERMKMGELGLGGARIAAYYADMLQYEIRNGGAPRPKLTSEQSVLAEEAFRRASQSNIDRMYRDALRATESAIPDRMEQLRSFEKVDRTNRRLMQQGRPIIEPSFEALPEYKIE